MEYLITNVEMRCMCLIPYINVWERQACTFRQDTYSSCVNAIYEYIDFDSFMVDDAEFS